jgi:hypothetical protein
VNRKEVVIGAFIWLVGGGGGDTNKCLNISRLSPHVLGKRRTKMKKCYEYGIMVNAMA